VSTVPTDRRRRQVGRNIRAAREDAGLSQRELAELIGVARTRIADYEAGRHEPNGVHIAAIAVAADRRVGWFYDNHEDGHP
jgi:transcriptional regulator with XRE-family HTH domain